MGRINKIIDIIIDIYLANPIAYDIVLTSLIWFTLKHFSIIDFILIDKANQVSILSSIISTDVSLAGFILAALTIIVTFKSNLKSKDIEDANNALELIFSSKHYNSIVNTFKKSLTELILCFLFVFVAWVSVDNLTIWTINRVNISGILITTLAIGRSLYILFIVLRLSKYKNENDPR